MTELLELYRRSVDEFDKRVQQIDEGQWAGSTPCPDWDVRTLVNHLVNENRWMAPLFAGKTVADVGDALDGDLLGDDPKGSWKAASAESLDVVHEGGALDRTVHLSFGDFKGSDYLDQILSDHVIHSWDLARGIGADDTLDPELVDHVAAFLEPQVEAWRSAGAFGPPADVPAGADAQTKLLGMVGRRA
jgi:uncharacterized protein (TIGR03086 family)